VPIVLKSGSLNLLEPSGPVQACNGIVLPFYRLCLVPFPSVTCFRRQFLRKIWQIQLAFLLLIVCWMFLSSLTHGKTSSFLTWSIHPFPSPRFKTFKALLLSEVSSFQHHWKLYSKHSTLLVSSLNLSPFADERGLLVECCFCNGNPGFNFTYTSCIICYHATHIVEMYHILHLFLI